MAGPTTKVETERRSEPRQGASPLADFFYDAFYGAAIGGSVVALFMAVVDAVAHELLYTPSLLGSVLFLGVEPSTVTEVRMDMVALFTIVHILTFGALGVTISALVLRMHEFALHPALVALLVFVLLEGGVLLADQTILRNALAEVGFLWVTLANALAGASMALFLLEAHRESDVEYVRRKKGKRARAGEAPPG